jgi:hypothetical protein
MRVGVPEIRPEELPLPELLVALTDTKYSVLFTSPVIRQLVALPPAEHWETETFESKLVNAVAVYPVRDDVPEKLGGVQLTTKVALPLKTDTFCGAEGVLVPSEICKLALPRLVFPHEARAT